MNCVLNMSEEENISLESGLASITRNKKSWKRRRAPELFEVLEPRRNLKKDFGQYELWLLFLTQFGYVPVAAAMLLSAFVEPTQGWCNKISESDTAWKLNPDNEFYSISVEHGYACQDSNYVTWISSLLMWGALVGSFVCGFLSDRFGRKPTYLGCLFMVSIGHWVLVFSDYLSWHLILGLLFLLGFFCGGYMVTNFVILTEAFELARSRLLVVSLNGWSLSMVTTGVIAALTPYWFTYHVIFALIGSILVAVSYVMVYESCRWLSAKRSQQEAKEIAYKIAMYNDKREFDEDELLVLRWYEVLGFSAPTHGEEKKTWTTLFKSIRFLKPTLVMCYSFFASSIVSFGFYFSIDILPGNRYTNMAIMGLMKFFLGFTPFICNSIVTKRVIAISSIFLCCFACILILMIQFFEVEWLAHVLVILTVIVAAGIDPTWKINHLYSAELFPTSVRSIARGFCNAGGRLGSVLAPMAVFLRTFNPMIPTLIFFVLLLIQLVVMIAFLPNDGDKDANEMNDE